MSKKKETKTVWDFVEENYPGYHSSEDIAKSDDLHKLVNEEQEDGDDATFLLDKEYKGDVRNPHILIDHNELLVQIYEKAIENFYKKQPKKK